MRSTIYANDFYVDNCTVGTSISVVEYGIDFFQETPMANIYELGEYLEKQNHFVWVSIKGKRDKQLVKDLIQMLKLHPMALNYLTNPTQLPRFENYDSYNLLIMNQFSLEEDDKVHISPIALLMGQNIIITIQNGADDPFSDIISGLRSGDARKEGLDYLVYKFIDNIIISYYPVINSLGAKLEVLEDDVVTGKNLDNEMGIKIHKLTRRFMFAYRALWSQKAALNDFINGSDLVATTKHSHYLRHCYDYALEMIDVVEMYNNMARNLMNVYLANVNNRINEIMKILTICVSVMAPFTIIAGIYGMNFDSLPGIHQWWGMPAAIGEMVFSSSIMLFIFRKIGMFKKIFKF